MTRIIADENIPFASEAFSEIGEVTMVAGRKLSRTDLLDAEILIVRSVTKVNRDLLQGTPVRFVGTATIGFDHVDTGYLAEQGIIFATAAGSNANSVAEYVVAALLMLDERKGLPLKGKTVGIVGVGNVGKKVAQKLSVLGMNVLLNDPPRAEVEGSECFVDLDFLLQNSDIVTFHTPLTKEGKYPSWHLLNAENMNRLRKDCVLINTSRGAVVDNTVLLAKIQSGNLHSVVLDVWEGEPRVSLPLLKSVDIASPHIAGYSFDGKVNGCQMMFEAVCQFLGESYSWDDQRFNVPVPEPDITLNTTGIDALRQAVFHAYPIQQDDQRMRQILSLSADEGVACFDQLRKNYPQRREFHRYRIHGQDGTDPMLNVLFQLGFSHA